MSSIKREIVWVLLFLAALTLSSSCARKKPVHEPGPGMEVWELQVTGDTKASYRMLLERVKIENQTYSIIGEFSGMADDHIGGRGMMECRFHGKIEKGRIKADFTGYANMKISVHVTGSFWGTLSKSGGSGKWQISHTEGESKGRWTMIRTNPSQ